MTLAIDFVGHSAVVVDLDGVRILTDPVIRARVGPLRRVRPVPDRHRMAGADAILISHLHWDHLDVPSLREIGRHTRILVPAGSGAWMRSAGFTNIQEVAVGDTVMFGDVSVRAVPAVHSGYRPPLGPTAPPLGFVITGSRSVYFAGDTDLFAGMAGLDQAIDVGLIPVWGWGPTLGRGLHLDPLKAAEALRMIRPRVAVPIHWGTYWPHAMGRVYPERLVEPPAAFAEYASELAPEVAVRLTDIGDPVDLSGVA